MLPAELGLTLCDNGTQLLDVYSVGSLCALAEGVQRIDELGRPSVEALARDAWLYTLQPCELLFPQRPDPWAEVFWKQVVDAVERPVLHRGLQKPRCLCGDYALGALSLHSVL